MLSRRRKSAVPENDDGDVLSEQDRLRLQRLVSEEDTSRGGDQ